MLHGCVVDWCIRACRACIIEDTSQRQGDTHIIVSGPGLTGWALRGLAVASQAVRRLSGFVGCMPNVAAHFPRCIVAGKRRAAQRMIAATAAQTAALKDDDDARDKECDSK